MSSEAEPCPSLESDRMTTIHTMPADEAYAGALVWWTRARDGALPVGLKQSLSRGKQGFEPPWGHQCLQGLFAALVRSGD